MGNSLLGLAFYMPFCFPLAMTDILTSVYALSCTQFVICFGIVSLFLTIFMNNVWISLCYFGALPAGGLLANQICTRTKFLDISAFLLTIQRMYQNCRTFSKAEVGSLNTERSHNASPPFKAVTYLAEAETDHMPDAEVAVCLDYIIRDFFESWYSGVSTEPRCHVDAQEYLASVVNNLFDKLRKIETVGMVHELSVIYTHHLRDIHKAKLYMCEEKRQIPCSVAMSQELLKIFQQINKFHPAVESEADELKYLRAFVEVLGHSMLPVSLYTCSSARYMLLDILTKNVVLPLINKLSEPHWLHKTLIKILSKDDTCDIATATNAQSRNYVACNKSRLNETDGATKMELDQLTLDAKLDAQQSSRNLGINSVVLLHGIHKDIPASATRTGVDNQAGLCETLHFCNTSSLKNGRAGGGTVEKANTLATSLPFGENLDLSRVSQKSELEEQQMFVAHDLGRYFHLQSDIPELQQSIKDQVKLSTETATDKRSHHHLPHEFTEVERHRTFHGLRLSSRSRSFSSLGGASSGSDTSLTARKAKFLLEQDEFSSHSDSGSRQSLDLDRASSRMAPLGCSFRQKWISSENFLKVDGYDYKTGSPAPLASHRRSRSETNLLALLADNECPAGEDDVKQDIQDWTTTVIEDAPAAVCGRDEPMLLFTSVTICDTVVAREPGSTGQYTLYVIEYTAWCKTEDAHWAQHQFIVRRRHKEFVALQQRLGSYPAYKSELKGVKGPLRWMSLPFANMDRRSVDSRRLFLQAYLQTLITKPKISGNTVMKEFFAYERDASIAFVKRAPTMPRIDKAITRTMSGVFNKISKIVPGTREVEPPSGRHAPQWPHDKRDVMNEPIEQEDWTDTLDVAFDIATTTLDGKETLDTILAHCIHGNGSLVGDEQSHDSNGTGVIGRPRRSEGDGCDASELYDKDDTPLTTIVVDLLTQLLTGRESWVKHNMAIRFFDIVFGRPLNRFLETELASLTTPIKCAHYIQLLRESVWPDGQLDGSATAISDSEKEMTRLLAKQCVHDFLPVLVPLLMGEDTYSYAVDAFMDSLDSATLNRHLLYCLLDQMLELIVPEVLSIEVQEELRQGDYHRDAAGY